MVRFAEAARLKLAGLPEGVDQHSPPGEQVSLIFTAMHQYAEKNNWEAFKRGAVPGRKGPFTMKYLIEQLFPKASRDERVVIQQIASSVLRQTGAAACIHNPSPSELGQGVKPTWYVADRMPDNLMVVATHHKPREPLQGDRLSEVERKLTPHEAGEDREPAPVETRSINQDTPEPSKAERDMIVNDQFVTEVFEQIATGQVPITIPELSQLTDKPQWAVRHATERLLAEPEPRIVWRVETREEKRVRGGGQLPPARPSRLFWVAPGPVPERTKLPDGIQPMKSSRAYAEERVAALRADEETIFDYLGSDEATVKGRSSGKIAAATGLPIDRVKAALGRLTSARRLRMNSAYLYYHSTAPVRQPRPPMDDPLDQPMPRPAEEPEDGDLLTQIYGLIEDLAREAGYEIEDEAETSEELTHLRDEVIRLSTENSELRRENQDLKQKVEKINKLLS